MNIEDIVKRYIDSWNRRDVTALLAQMHPGAAFYDAFWMESCVGPDLAQYFRDAMDEGPFWYSHVGETLRAGNNIVFRYSAHHRAGSQIGEPIYHGAEILNILDGKILTVTDMYCSPDRSDLIELAGLTSRRHGLTSHANCGLGALKTARIKQDLAVKLDEERCFLDPEITITRLAEEIGCTLKQLAVVLESQFGASFADFVDARRVEYAKELMERGACDDGTLDGVATSVGFRSLAEFRKKFSDIVGVTPTVFCRQQSQRKSSPKDASLH